MKEPVYQRVFYILEALVEYFYSRAKQKRITNYSAYKS